MALFDELESELKLYLPPEEINLIHQAYKLSAVAHKNQVRTSGEPYITHPVAVAGILAGMRLDHQSIMAALLHDVLEDSDITKDLLAEKFGKPVADLVDGVTKLTQMHFESRAERQAENFRKMMLAMTRDIRVILIKMADRLHNMRTLDVLAPFKRRRIARETLDIFAPIANRLGMHQFRNELETLGFEAYYPMRYRIIKNAVEKAKGHRKQIMRDIEIGLSNTLSKTNIRVHSIESRAKHFYRIYLKMQQKHLSFNEIMDIYGFRIIVDNPDECYRVLGVTHRLYKPLTQRFKDYIAIPKANGYQSLHTTLFGPYGVPIEIQVRTKEMDEMANNGIAAHWLYKSQHGGGMSDAQMRAQQWLQDILEIQKRTGNSLEFVENVKIDLFPEEVYVFTPKGEILELPSGSTPIDYAYAIHSDVGNTCVAAKIDRRLAPLSAKLLNGQRVEIITSPYARPNPAWLNFVITGKARSNIRHFLKSQQRAEAIQFGKRLLERALSSLNQTLDKIDNDNWQVALQQHQLDSQDDLFEALGLGNQMAPVIAQQLMQQAAEKEEEKPKNYALQIKGSEGTVVQFAECCRPIPGDNIVGKFKAGQGITVHRDDCSTMRKARSSTASDWVDVRWADDLSGEFKTRLQIQVKNQRGVLAKIATSIAEADANIDNIVVDEQDGKFNLLDILVSVKDRIHLAKVLRRIRILPVVVKITRI